MFSYLANPRRFMRFSAFAAPVFWLIAVLCIGLGWYQGLYTSPAEADQGETVRIMYAHVPAAWTSVIAFVGLGVASLSFLIWKHPLADSAARALALIGICMTALCLVSGMIWGYDDWGQIWAWDARLTSVLILFLLYCGYLALRYAFDDDRRGAKAAAILALIGLINLPIIRYSVDWWTTAHQPSVALDFSRDDNPLPWSMRGPLLLAGLGYLAFLIAATFSLMQADIMERRVRAREVRT